MYHWTLSQIRKAYCLISLLLSSIILKRWVHTLIEHACMRNQGNQSTILESILLTDMFIGRHALAEKDYNRVINLMPQNSAAYFRRAALKATCQWPFWNARSLLKGITEVLRASSWRTEGLNTEGAFLKFATAIKILRRSVHTQIAHICLKK